jgi:hypothetical protein
LICSRRAGPDAALLDIRLGDGEVVYPVADALAALGIRSP